jgi:hypothetical protein
MLYAYLAELLLHLNRHISVVRTGQMVSMCYVDMINDEYFDKNLL